MFQLCYGSRATHPFTKDELSAILAKARPANRARGISGLLVYADQSFLQILEGEEEIVRTIFRKIKADPRHTDVTVHFSNAVEQRSFEDWSMGFFYADASATSNLPGYEDLFSKSLAPADFHRGDAARRIFLEFRDGLWRQHVQL